jgi:uncharacterized protein YfaP (DUF2135 family)
LLLFNKKNGCHNSARLNAALSNLDESISQCCRCSESENERPIDGLSQEELDTRRLEAGGNDGTLRVSLAWNSIVDLDLVVKEPDGNVIWFDHPISASGGHLDVDRNRADGALTDTPIENVYWRNPVHGQYEVTIFLYSRNSISEYEDLHATLEVSKNGKTSIQNYWLTGADRSPLKTIQISYP